MKQAVAAKTVVNSAAKSYIVPSGESMIRFLGKLTRSHRVGDVVKLRYKGAIYSWEKTSANGWSKVKKNPYASQAQRRKFHAMEKRGEISARTVKEFDRASKGRKLPERANPYLSKECASLKAAERYQNRLYNLYNHVRLVQSPRFTEKGNYIWEVKDKIERKPNATASQFVKSMEARLKELGRRFQGKHTGEKRRLLQSDFTPQKKYRLGHLVQMKIKANGVTVPLNFDGDSMLSADLSNRLHVVGKDARISANSLKHYGIKVPKTGEMQYLGKLMQIDYVTDKAHIENGETVRFFHKLGEVTKEVPNVFVDHDGFPQIIGGAYDIWDVGIVN